MHGLVDEEALARGAALARAEEGRDDARLGGGGDVRVLEHDHRPVAAELEQQRLARGARRDLRPVSIEPMNATACVPALPAISSPTTAPGPVTMLKTPAGSSASTTHSASLTAQIAVERAGVQTTAFPAASAGASSSDGIVYGQFHGVITPTTPRGTR